MQFRVLCVVALAATANTLDVTPVQKVLTLLQGMLEHGKKEKADEKVSFAKSSQWCADTEFAKTNAVKDGKETIADLSSKIDKATSDVASLARKIAKSGADQATLESDISAGNDLRATQKADYDKTNKDYGESIEAIGRAIKTMAAQVSPTAQAGSLLQVAAANLVPAAAKKAIDSFLQQGLSGDDDALLQGLETGAPEANAYESQSSGVVGMLNQLQKKFMTEQSTLQRNEQNMKGAHAVLTQDLNAQVEQTKNDISKKTVNKAKRAAFKSDKTEDKNQAAKMLSDDSKFLSKLKADCSMEVRNFASRQQLRADEIEAIEKAMEIISSNVAGRATKHLPSLLQNKATSLVGLRQASSNAEVQMQQRVAQFLRDQAEMTNSRVLSAVAQKMGLLRVGADPMKKVKKMIQDMVVKLNEQANDEADAKGVCDVEMASNKQTRTEKAEAVSTLTAEIDGLTSNIAKLTKDTKTLTEQVATLDKAAAEKTKIRTDEDAKNKATIADAKAAQGAVAQALVVLREFYQKAGDATALVQQPVSQGGDAAEAFQGQASASTGVVGMLEVIESDFARLEAETKTTEATEQKKYDEFTTATRVDKAAKETENDHKAKKKVKKEHDLAIAQKDLEQNQKSLNVALTYFDKLKKSCVDSGVSHEDRAARRKTEIGNLQEALKMLEADEA